MQKVQKRLAWGWRALQTCMQKVQKRLVPRRVMFQ
jgi:hypothetical protein